MAKAQTLSNQQQKKVLSNDKKKKKSAPKNILCTPYSTKWPPLLTSLDEDIQQKLVTEITKHDLKRPVIDKNLTKGERNEALNTIQKDPAEIQRQAKRNWLVCGVNAVTRAVERDLVSVVLVDRASFIITRHIMELCAVRGCTFFPMRQLAQLAGPRLSVTQLSALAIKTGDEGPFGKFVDFVKLKVPKVELPWLTVAEMADAGSIPESEEQNVDQSSVTSHSGIQDRVGLKNGDKPRYLSDNRSKSEKSSSKSKSGVVGEFIGFDTDSDYSSDSRQNQHTQQHARMVSREDRTEESIFDAPLGFVDDHVRPMKRKWQMDTGKKDKLENKSNIGKKQKQAKNVKYHAANLHKLQGNENRQGKKKKSK